MSISSKTCLAFSMVGLDPAMSSTYACSRRSLDASGNSDNDVFARVLMEFAAMSGAGLSPKLNRYHWYTVGMSLDLLLHRNL